MKIDVLDHGYVEFIEAWGTGNDGFGTDGDPESRDHEAGIIEAARQSTQGAFRGWNPAACDCGHAGLVMDMTKQGKIPPGATAHHRVDCASIQKPGDRRLLSYLYNNNHETPFEFAGMVIEVQAPIFVFREWHRHRTQAFNEMSARYAPLPDLYYLPDAFNVKERTTKGRTGLNKQAQSQGHQDESVNVNRWLRDVAALYEDAETLYQNALRSGIPKELARIVNPVGHYSRMRASANLRNWCHFLSLRMAENAQWEIRQYAEAVYRIMRQAFPQTLALFDERRL